MIFLNCILLIILAKSKFQSDPHSRFVLYSWSIIFWFVLIVWKQFFFQFPVKVNGILLAYSETWLIESKLLKQGSLPISQFWYCIDRKVLRSKTIMKYFEMNFLKRRRGKTISIKYFSKSNSTTNFLGIETSLFYLGKWWVLQKRSINYLSSQSPYEIFRSSCNWFN